MAMPHHDALAQIHRHPIPSIPNLVQTIGALLRRLDALMLWCPNDNNAPEDLIVVSSISSATGPDHDFVPSCIS